MRLPSGARGFESLRLRESKTAKTLIGFAVFDCTKIRSYSVFVSNAPISSSIVQTPSAESDSRLAFPSAGIVVR